MRSVPHGSILVGDIFVEHQLAINWVYIGLKYMVAPEGVAFRSWHRFRAPLSSTVPIIPDGYAEFETRIKVVSAFVEVDLGNESHAVWKTKIEAYLHLAVSGEFEQRFARQQFRVLVIAHSAGRVERLQKLIHGYTDKVFWLSTLDAIRSSGIWSAIWLRPAHDEPQPLVGGAL